MKELKETILVTMMSFMFWQIMYPQFALTKDTYLCLDREEKNPEEDFFRILEAEEGEIVIKSKLWEWMQHQME